MVMVTDVISKVWRHPTPSQGVALDDLDQFREPRDSFPVSRASFPVLSGTLTALILGSFSWANTAPAEEACLA